MKIGKLTVLCSQANLWVKLNCLGGFGSWTTSQSKSTQLRSCRHRYRLWKIPATMSSTIPNKTSPVIMPAARPPIRKTKCFTSYVDCQDIAKPKYGLKSCPCFNIVEPTAICLTSNSPVICVAQLSRASAYTMGSLEYWVLSATAWGFVELKTLEVAKTWSHTNTAADLDLRNWSTTFTSHALALRTEYRLSSQAEQDYLQQDDYRHRVPLGMSMKLDSKEAQAGLLAWWCYQKG